MNITINSLVDELEQELIYTRRHLHQYPELSGEEYETANFLMTKFEEMGIDAKIIDTEVGPGVVAQLNGKSKTPLIAFRADMDALPLVDKKLCTYSSKRHGVAHSCGHDFNTTSILGLAKVLVKLQNQMEGSVKFIFQPSEESAEGGAAYVLKAGIMENVDAIWAVHAFPDLPAGKIGVRYGAITSATDGFKITVKGVSGHSARPQLSVDAIYVATQIINGLYSIIYRKFDPRQPIVISVGIISGGTAPNIVANKVEFEGTIRMFDQDIRSKVPEIISAYARSIAKAHNADCDMDWHFGPPPVINNDKLAKITENASLKVLGEGSVVIINRPSMGAEDFSRFLWHAPGMLIRIGTGGEEYASYPLHNPMFDINEKAIAYTVKVLSTIVMDYFEGKKSNTDN
ncbi:MAG: M20 family metallopeptidase [Vampirovibrionia bacterium]